MPTRTKVYLILLSSLALQFMGLWGLYQYHFLPNIQQVETQRVNQEILNAYSLIFNQLEQNAQIAAIFSEHEEIQQLINGSSYGSRIDFGLSTQGIDLIQIFDESKETIYKLTIDPETRQHFELPNLLRLIRNNYPSMMQLKQGEKTKGILISTRGPLLIYAHKTTSHKGKPYTIMIGRFISQSFIFEANRNRNGQLSLWPLGTNRIPVDQKNVLNEAILSNEYLIRHPSENVLKGFTPLLDLSGQPKLLLSVALNRDFFIHTNALISDFTIMLLALNIIILLLVQRVIYRDFVIPISDMGDKLKLLEENPEKLIDIPSCPSSEVNRFTELLNQYFKKQAEYQHQTQTRAHQMLRNHIKEELLTMIAQVAKPVSNQLSNLENDLLDFPLNEFEKIIAEFFAADVSQQDIDDMVHKMHALNSQFKALQDNLRIKTNELRTCVNTMMGELRLHSNQLQLPKVETTNILNKRT